MTLMPSFVGDDQKCTLGPGHFFGIPDSQARETCPAIKSQWSTFTNVSGMQELDQRKTRTGKGIVIFDTMFGSTQKIAESFCMGLKRASVEAECTNANSASTESLKDYDFIAVGAPTHGFSASQPVKEFLERMAKEGGLKGMYGFAFDTRYNSRFSGSGAGYIEKRLVSMGLQLVRPRSSGFVKHSEGPLAEGEEKRFEQLGFEVGIKLSKLVPVRS